MWLGTFNLCVSEMAFVGVGGKPQSLGLNHKLLHLGLSPLANTMASFTPPSLPSPSLTPPPSLPPASPQPTSAELTQTVRSLLQLKISSPALSSAVDQLCEVIRKRVGELTGAIRVRWEVLQMFVSFCSLDEKVCQEANPAHL